MSLLSTLQTQSVHTPEGMGASRPLTCPSISRLKLCEWVTEKERKIKKGNTEEKEERTERVLDIHACSYLQNCRAREAPGFTVQTKRLEFRKAPHLFTGPPGRESANPRPEPLSGLSRSLAHFRAKVCLSSFLHRGHAPALPAGHTTGSINNQGGL